MRLSLLRMIRFFRNSELEIPETAGIRTRNNLQGKLICGRLLSVSELPTSSSRRLRLMQKPDHQTSVQAT